MKSLFILLFFYAIISVAQTSTFNGYSGGGCGTSANCTTTITAKTDVSAGFTLNGGGGSTSIPCNISKGNFNVGTNRLPANCYPYNLAISMWGNRLPLDKMMHLWQANSSPYNLPHTSDWYAQQNFVANGTFSSGGSRSNTSVNCSIFAYNANPKGTTPSTNCNVGPSGGQLMSGFQIARSASSVQAYPNAPNAGDEPPIWYSKATDPVFLAASSPGSGGSCSTGLSETSHVCPVFHAPANAQWTGPGTGGNCFVSTTNGAAGNGSACMYNYNASASANSCTSSYPACVVSTNRTTLNETCGDTFIDVFDQSQNLFVSMYECTPIPDIFFPNCTQGNCQSFCGGHAGTLTDPCPIGSFSNADYAASEDYLTDYDWTTQAHTITINGVAEYLGAGGDNGSGMSTGTAPARVTMEDMMNGIFHIAQGNSTDNAILPLIWPGTVCNAPSPACPTGGGGTNSSPTGMPGGAIVFLDYTDAQINSMGLQSRGIQNILITQLSHYGANLENWPSDTYSWISGAGEVFENDNAYFNATGTHHPFFPWVNGQKIGVGTTQYGTGYQYTINCNPNLNSGANMAYGCEYDALYGLPLETCNTINDPGCSTRTDLSGRQCSISPGCDVSGHIHVVDPAVLAGYIGPGQRSGEPDPVTGVITVMIPGGGGTIISNPAGMNCDHVVQCNVSMTIGQQFVLTAVPNANYNFTGWSNGCSGTATCSLTTTANPQSVTATFAAL